MAEEQEQEGTWSGLKKTIIGVATTLVTAGGVWVSTLLGGGDKAEPTQPAAAPVINITTNQTQQQAAGGNKTVIINKGGDGGTKPTQTQPKPKKKEGDEFKEETPKW
jgi:flagellar basal body-associated protein FliL